ncbi:hypothetical protein HAZT_HAZT000067 [Hyalella azteca]|uniref:Cytochrome b5-like n=1 Tax=Hyalella azteca TaxID=294128 RepID=A0A6A0H461_HYAAZ|nr:cytochrome b5-like [Hyalella azteca]KAA0199141.1 hypothetical protein HAZT_HAZT000067 [Hyalella azteca]
MPLNEVKVPMKEYSREEVKKHCNQQDCWIIIDRQVYDVTQYLAEHPGGVDVILEYGGRDATAAFLQKGHSADAEEILSSYLIGSLRT